MLSGQPDDGAEVHEETITRLFRVPARLNGAPADPAPEAALLALEEAKRQALLDLAEQQNGEWLDTENDKLDAYADDLETAFAAEVKALEAEIKEAKKALRGASLAMQDKLAEKRRISAPGGQARQDEGGVLRPARPDPRRGRGHARSHSGEPEAGTDADAPVHDPLGGRMRMGTASLGRIIRLYLVDGTATGVITAEA